MDGRDGKTSPGKEAGLKIYKIKDFIRLTETGEIDIDRSKQIVRQLAVAAAFHANHDILLDMRDRSIRGASLGRVLEVALEFGRYKSAFRGKIASILPADKARLRTAKQLKILMESPEFRYEIFTSFEDAVEWLFNIKHVQESSG